MTNEAAQLNMRKTDAESEWIFPATTATGRGTVHPRSATLASLAGPRSWTRTRSTTRRYVHPQADTIKAAMERARGGHSESEMAGSTKPSAVDSNNDSGMNGRGGRIRTSDLLVPNQDSGDEE